jgi:hypothetical protein
MDRIHAIVAERFWPALSALVAAFHYAEDSQLDRWQFAISLGELQESGATLADFRWLILRGLAEHALETTIPGEAERSFRKLAPTAFPMGTCLVLSSLGASSLTKLLGSLKDATDPIEGLPTPSAKSKERPSPGSRPTPEWDPIRRELRYGRQVVKRYRVPAPNQELVLISFQESGWPEFIDDPLLPLPDQDCKERLQATIKSLNRNQISHSIRFHGNGNGEQVYWQPLVLERKTRRRTRSR